jgi:hypothetical protein
VLRYSRFADTQTGFVVRFYWRELGMNRPFSLIDMRFIELKQLATSQRRLIAKTVCVVDNNAATFHLIWKSTDG